MTSIPSIKSSLSAAYETVKNFDTKTKAAIGVAAGVALAVGGVAVKAIYDYASIVSGIKSRVAAQTSSTQSVEQADAAPKKGIMATLNDNKGKIALGVAAVATTAAALVYNRGAVESFVGSKAPAEGYVQAAKNLGAAALDGAKNNLGKIAGAVGLVAAPLVAKGVAALAYPTEAIKRRTKPLTTRVVDTAKNLGSTLWNNKGKIAAVAVTAGLAVANRGKIASNFNTISVLKEAGMGYHLFKTAPFNYGVGLVKGLFGYNFNIVK